MITKIKDRKIIFEKTRISLKSEFFGIDEQIDKMMDSISAWFLAPEIITRPVIVNLWGLTGVGKTSLIRSLTNKLGFSSKFLELQMSGKENRSIISTLLASNVVAGEMGVILLDEFQRFRTVCADGKDVKNESSMGDIWMLLSDGKFTADGIFKILYDIAKDADHNIGFKNYKRSKIKVDDTITKIDDNYFDSTYAWSNDKTKLNSLKRYIYKGKDEYEILQLTDSEIKNDIENFIKNTELEYIDYTKCLIFISANLDEAFSVSGDVEDCDTDADIFHEFTKKISVITIKKALTKRFRPEQIARLGNDHIIYPSLSRYTYEQLIKHNCSSYTKQASEVSGISLSIDTELFKIIYDNSVYPTQGTRPVFSTIQKIFTSPLARGLLWCVENNFKNCKISMTQNPSTVKFTHSKEEFSVDIDLDIADAKSKYSNDYSALVAAHEAGHAIVYAELMNDAPKEVKINVASFTGGYNLLDAKAKNKKAILDGLAVSYGGIVAEEILFGSDNRSSGCSSDISNATRSASNYVRCYGMNGINGRVAIDSSFTNFIQNTDESDKHIEEILKESKKKASDIINKHKNLLIEISKHLLQNNTMKKEEFIEKYKHIFEFKTSSDDIHGNYYELLMSQ